MDRVQNVIVIILICTSLLERQLEGNSFSMWQIGNECRVNIKFTIGNLIYTLHADRFLAHSDSL